MPNGDRVLAITRGAVPGRSGMFQLRVTVTLALAAAAFMAATYLSIEAPVHAQRQNSGWQLPEDAPQTKNPLPVNDALLATGKNVFSEKCQKCHGEKGLGDGPDAEPEHAEHMNLTNPARANRNPDGIVFYKVMNGRRNPKMPAFKEELSTEQIWAVVAYVQTLRKK
jgi:mono/diheme cytochrome c family protein